MTLSKPEKRAPRPKKRLARGKRPNRVKKTSRGKMGRTADKLFSLIVRARAKCLFHEFNGQCGGPLQTCHVVSRSYRSVRWDEDNAFCMCAGAHRLMTCRPLEWERFVTAVMGAAEYEALKARALAKWDGEVPLVRLAERAVSMGNEAK